jgi:hypothetical protein
MDGWSVGFRDIIKVYQRAQPLEKAIAKRKKEGRKESRA